jgi:hypothetical protein
MKNKKGQETMEFLMTYGWAILIVLIAIGALIYFGAFDKLGEANVCTCSQIQMNHIAQEKINGIYVYECKNLTYHVENHHLVTETGLYRCIDAEMRVI